MIKFHKNRKLTINHYTSKEQVSNTASPTKRRKKFSKIVLILERISDSIVYEQVFESDSIYSIGGVV